MRREHPKAKQIRAAVRMGKESIREISKRLQVPRSMVAGYLQRKVE